MILLGCQIRDNSTQQQPDLTQQPNEGKEFSQYPVQIEDKTSTVDVTSYILITDDIGRDSSEADAVMQIKIFTPIAMQKHDSALFDSILAKEFIKRAENEFF